MTSQPNPGKPKDPFALFDAVIREAGGDPKTPVGKRAREIMHTATKLLKDDANLGEMKLLSSSLKELRYALKVFRDYREVPKVSIFGSARTPEDHPDYQAAVTFGQHMAHADWMVITGAGDGIMRAGHGGAGAEQSFGVSIRLPFETNANDYIAGDPKLVVFRYFFTRKLMFLWEAQAVALFPGGFGTQDEGFESLTMTQTGKAPIVPIVMVDGKGGDYWQNWERYVKRELLDNQWISEEDPNLYFITDDPREAADHVLRFYRNYHSQRYVQENLVLRIRRPITEEQLDHLNCEFALLVEKGTIKQSGPLAGETDYPDLTRLSFHHTKYHFGVLRKLIDRVNDFDLANEQAGPPA